MTLDSRSSHPAPIRVTTLARALRIYVVTVFGLSGAQNRKTCSTIAGSISARTRRSLSMDLISDANSNVFPAVSV